MIQQIGDLFGNSSSATLKIFSSAVKVATNIPVSITKGLNRGVYERVGGVVREMAGRADVVAEKTVMWLRDGNALKIW